MFLQTDSAMSPNGQLCCHTAGCGREQSGWRPPGSVLMSLWRRHIVWTRGCDRPWRSLTTLTCDKHEDLRHTARWPFSQSICMKMSPCVTGGSWSFQVRAWGAFLVMNKHSDDRVVLLAWEGEWWLWIRSTRGQQGHNIGGDQSPVGHISALCEDIEYDKFIKQSSNL